MRRISDDDNGYALEVDDKFDTDMDLKFVMPGIGTSYLQRVEVEELRDHLSTLLGESEEPTIATMTAEVRDLNTAKGWRNGSNTFGDYIALLHSEVSEALDAYRDHRLTDGTRPVCGLAAQTGAACPTHGLSKPEGVGSELADVLIRLLDTADVYGIDLVSEYSRKMAYNRTRPYQHGGRTLSDG